MTRTAAALFGAASVITLLSVILPHQPQLETGGLIFVSGCSAIVTAVLLIGGERLPAWTIHLWAGGGTVLISFGLLFNGERHGGAAGMDEMYYLWVVLYATYYLRRLGTAAHVVFIAAAYTVTLIAIDPGPIATSRWLTTVGLATGLRDRRAGAHRADRAAARRAAARRLHRPAHRPAQPPRDRAAQPATSWPAPGAPARRSPRW